MKSAGLTNKHRLSPRFPRRSRRPRRCRRASIGQACETSPSKSKSARPVSCPCPRALKTPPQDLCLTRVERRCGRRCCRLRIAAIAGHLSLCEVSRGGTTRVPPHPTRYVSLYMYTTNNNIYYTCVFVDKDKYRARGLWEIIPFILI